MSARPVVALVCIAALVVGTAHARRPPCGFIQNLDDRVSGLDVREIDIRTDAGKLNIVGRNTTEIAVSGEACGTFARLAQQVDWSLTRQGSRVFVRVRVPPPANEHYAELDLEIIVPLGMDVEVRDTRGAVTIQGAGEVYLEQGPGSVRVSDSDGPVQVIDSAGSLYVAGIRSHVRVRDGAGALEIDGVLGDVYLEDGTGSIKVNGVSGSVEVKRDGAGNIDVREIGGDFIVRRDDSGKIRHKGVAGAVRLPD